ncbi:enoyl-CoA hydratase/isomerase family protein, partial [bacterium]|nr:enoyl-CoA hydratase/isomerase family protein [bacterium]
KIVTELFNPMVQAIKQSAKPVVAQVTGTAAGAGSSLALACDVVFAASNAAFSLPFLKIALLPDTGASYFIVKQLGYKKAFELFAGNKTLSASEAETCRLINQVVDEKDLDEQCITYCLGLAKMQGESLAHLKQLLQSAETAVLTDVLSLEAYYQDQAAKSPHFEEAIKQFKTRK